MMYRTGKNKQLHKGFTLIEVLIALAILAIALLAVIKLAAQSVNDTLQVKEKIAAHWVALNILAEAQAGYLQLNSTVRSLSGNANMFDLQWHWQLDLQTTVSDYLQTVKVVIMPKNSKSIVDTLQGQVMLTTISQDTSSK